MNDILETLIEWALVLTGVVAIGGIFLQNYRVSQKLGEQLWQYGATSFIIVVIIYVLLSG